MAAAALGSRALRQAADSFERAARQPHGRIPASTPAGNQLRHAARLIAAYAYLTQERWLTEVPRGFRTVHPIGWMSGKVK